MATTVVVGSGSAASAGSPVASAAHGHESAGESENY